MDGLKCGQCEQHAFFKGLTCSGQLLVKVIGEVLGSQDTGRLL